MKKFKHSKYKNTGVLFELLIRQVVADTLNDKNSVALSIVKEHFGKKSELVKEFRLYKMLVSEKFDTDGKAGEFLSIILEERAKLNESKLNREKYNLIKDIKKNYSIDEFFNYRVSNYKENASIYKLFSYTKSENPKDYVDNKSTILEHITKSKKVESKQPSIIEEEYSKQTKEVRILALKMLVDSFNSKYTNLSKPQKAILSEYINSVGNTDYLKEYVKKECKKIKSALGKFDITDKVVKIKVNEVITLIDRVGNSKKITENEILSLLRYYDLYKELKESFNEA